MVVYSLDVTKDPFRPYENGEKLLSPEVPYLIPLVHLCIFIRADNSGVLIGPARAHTTLGLEQDRVKPDRA